MTDPTELLRRKRLAEVNAHPAGLEALTAGYGQVRDTRQLAGDFHVLGFLAPGRGPEHGILIAEAEC
jgi:hypothetical protein